MYVSVNEVWTLLHGMTFGALFLLAFGGGFAGLYSLRPELMTAEGVKERLDRAKVPESPRSILLSSPLTAGWHKFGMEWKEHIAWIAPILATVVAYLVYYYGRRLVREEKIRRIAITMFTLAFASAAVAGVFGALITKAAPVK